PGDVDGAQTVVHGDFTACPLEDRERAVEERRIDRAIVECPVVVASVVLPDAVATGNRAVIAPARGTVPEAQHQPTGVDEVDLMSDRGLHVEIGVRRYGAQGKSRATERAAVVEHPVDAGFEATPGTRGDVKGTAEHQIATNVDQVVERTADHIGL